MRASWRITRPALRSRKRESWADLQNVLMDLGKVVLPVLNPAIKLFDDHLKTTLFTFDELGKAVDWVKSKLPSLNPLQGGNDNHGDGPSLAPLLPIQKNSFSPSGANGGAEAPVHITTAVYLDGRIIGETVSTKLARLSTFPVKPHTAIHMADGPRRITTRPRSSHVEDHGAGALTVAPSPRSIRRFRPTSRRRSTSRGCEASRRAE